MIEVVTQLGYLCTAALFIFALNWMYRGRHEGACTPDYFTDHTWMLFGDAKEVVGELAKQLAADASVSRTEAA